MKGEGFKVGFGRSLRLEFYGSKVTSDAGLIACRDLDEALGLFDSLSKDLSDVRTGRNIQHGIKTFYASPFTAAWQGTRITLWEKSLFFPAQNQKIVDTLIDNGYFIAGTIGISRFKPGKAKDFAQNQKRRLSFPVSILIWGISDEIQMACLDCLSAVRQCSSRAKC